MSTPARRTVLAVGGHIGDAELTAGPLLAALALAGHDVSLLALTPGERGHPTLSPEEYKAQKIHEGEYFATAIGAGFQVFGDQSDGFLGTGDDVAVRVAEVFRAVRPDIVVTHWHRSIHTDHENAATLVTRGRFLAGLPYDVPSGAPRWSVPVVLHAENWEDMAGFEPLIYAPISDEAFDRWREGIGEHAFARGETYGFRYIDYYTALMTARGCLAPGRGGSRRAVALAGDAAADVLSSLL